MPFRPFVLAGLLAVAYTLLCAGYIAYSSQIAANFAGSMAELERIEITKGIIFVTITGWVYFGFALLLLKRIARQQSRIHQQQSALVAAEGRAMAGIFAASVAHDMKNLLTTVSWQTERFKFYSTGAAAGESVQQLETAVDDLTTLAKRLMAISRAGAPDQTHQVDLVAAIRKIVAIAPTHVKIRGCRLTTTIDKAIARQVTESIFGRLLMNLILNAAEATRSEGHIEVRATQDTTSVFLEVHDNGPGVPEDSRTKIFDAFYTTKPDGTGLGLLSVKVGASEHGGSVQVLKSDLGGACFRIILPRPPVTT